MKILKIIISALILAIAIFLLVYFIPSSDPFESAISEFEDEDYIESIEMLNRLIKVTGYEKGEKIYYYRCRAINRLAQQIEEDFSDELKKISLDKKNTPAYVKYKRKVEEELKEINEKIKGDLILVPSLKKSGIISRGMFYDEFISKYRGSSYIEDLDFEELQKTEKTNPGKMIISIVNYYKRYPNTNYISQIVKMLFQTFEKGNLKLANREKYIWDIIITFGQRYPTSPEVNKIFQLKGDNVNLRNSPGLEGKLVGKIKKDEILIQLERSMDTYQIGETRDYWYRIISLKGLRGWIFGKFLNPMDITKFKIKKSMGNWTFEELFLEWKDSNTPKNWNHIKNAHKLQIGFLTKGKINIAQLNSPSGKVSGLFSKYNSSKAFSILSRARYISGDGLTIFIYSLGGGKIFYVMLKSEEIIATGRKIPLATSDWHEYLLMSDDGKHANLYIDGELISGKIPPMIKKDFKLRGVYILYSSIDEESKGEMEYIKIR
ncbi:SH3 domain-containing protein [Spirochaetota bacterium]